MPFEMKTTFDPKTGNMRHAVSFDLPASLKALAAHARAPQFAVVYGDEDGRFIEIDRLPTLARAAWTCEYLRSKVALGTFGVRAVFA